MMFMLTKLVTRGVTFWQEIGSMYRTAIPELIFQFMQMYADNIGCEGKCVVISSFESTS